MGIEETVERQANRFRLVRHLRLDRTDLHFVDGVPRTFEIKRNVPLRKDIKFYGGNDNYDGSMIIRPNSYRTVDRDVSQLILRQGDGIEIVDFSEIMNALASLNGRTIVVLGRKWEYKRADTYKYKLRSLGDNLFPPFLGIDFEGIHIWFGGKYRWIPAHLQRSKNDIDYPGSINPGRTINPDSVYITSNEREVHYKTVRWATAADVGNIGHLSDAERAVANSQLQRQGSQIETLHVVRWGDLD